MPRLDGMLHPLRHGWRGLSEVQELKVRERVVSPVGNQGRVPPNR